MASCFDNFLNQCGGMCVLVGDFVRGQYARLRGLRLSLVAAIEQPQSVAYRNFVADLLLGCEADRRVNSVIYAKSSPANCCDGVSDFSRVNSNDKSSARGFYPNLTRCQREKLRVVIADARVAVLRFHIAA